MEVEWDEKRGRELTRAMERLFQDEGSTQMRGVRHQAGAGEKKRGPCGFRITARDRAIVRWIGRQRMVTAAQIGERFELGRAVSYARLGGLTQLGLLEHQRIFHAEPGVYLATRQGLHAVDLELPPARVDLRTYRHDVELSSLVIELEREFGPERVVTEREIRATDTPGLRQGSDYRPRFGVLLPASGSRAMTPAGHPRVHYPDAAVLAGDSGGGLAIELERALKGRTRLRSILRAYVAARHVGRVRYYATRPETARLLQEEIVRLRAEGFIECRASALRGAAVAPAPDAAA
jgi:hypothetical protein